MRTWASSRLSKCPAVEEFVAEPAVERLSIQAFCHGEPGSMKIGIDTVESAPVRDCAFAMNSGPLSNRNERGRAARRSLSAVEGRDNACRRRQCRSDDDRRAFAGELVNDVQQLQGAAINGGVEQEVESPTARSVRWGTSTRPRYRSPRWWLLAFPVWHFAVLPRATGAAHACY